ncbi:HAD family hydrolase [Labrys wisconsinensis]|uniref:HAD superfamily hydrolase (TIGR01509 family) n=1 Tax=Labrys wisconsinensis TaxID=425677 RepID=A0ABU0J3E2_9HYPH|nr:HAD family hydrolase [Labrys wisconsinensis]MDQ0468788.1 HAD superfamily hydrolase (TIGR01509 family) [Labrys wisconsinensis]
MRYSLVIFDCDGVLIDSEILSAEATAHMLTDLGVPMTAERCMSLFLGMTQADMESTIEREFALRLAPDFAQRTTALLMQSYRDRLRAIDGVRELLERLPVPFCVASNSPPAKLGLGLSLTDLFESFYPHIYCSKLVERGKPAPDLFLYAAGQLGVAPAQTIVVEDSVAGVTAAKAAGMTALGFTGGLHSGPASAERLRAAGADHIAETMDEVRVLLGLDD